MFGDVRRVAVNMGGSALWQFTDRTLHLWDAAVNRGGLESLGPLADSVVGDSD